VPISDNGFCGGSGSDVKYLEALAVVLLVAIGYPNITPHSPCSV
jgi:hypothetical protein